MGVLMRSYLRRRARQYVVGMAPIRWRLFFNLVPVCVAVWISNGED